MRQKRLLLWAQLMLWMGIAFPFAVLASERSELVPFAVTQTYSVTAPNKIKTTRHRIELSVRSDGSQSRHLEGLAQDGFVLFERREIHDVSSKQVIVLDPLTKSKTTGFMAEPVIDRLSKKLDPSCDAHLLPGSIVEKHNDRILGYEVVKTTENSSLPNGGTMTIIEWRAPRLNCFPLPKEVTFVTSGGLTTVNLHEVGSVVRGEPAPELFEVPDGYTERSPSEVVAETARVNGQLCVGCGEDFVLRADQTYYKSQEPPPQ